MGFVKISDDLPNWAWINDPQTVYIYIRLLLGAVWTETDYRNVHLKRGQIAISQREFAEKCGVTYQELRTILKRLISTQKITQSTEHKISIITLLEYDCGAQPSTQSATEYQRDNNAILTQYQRNTNATTLYNTDNKTIREQSSAGAQLSKKELLVEAYGSANVAEYERRFDEWAAKQGGNITVDKYSIIAKWLKQDGVTKPQIHSSFDTDDTMSRIKQRYKKGADI